MDKKYISFDIEDGYDDTYFLQRSRNAQHTKDVHVSKSGVGAINSSTLPSSPKSRVTRELVRDCIVFCYLMNEKQTDNQFKTW